MKLKFIASASLVLGSYFYGNAQILTLQEALSRTEYQYDKIKSKQQLVEASAQNTAFQKLHYLPDFTLGFLKIMVRIIHLCCRLKSHCC